MYCLGFQNQTPSPSSPFKFFTLSSSLITIFFVSLSQFSLTLIPHYFPSSSLFLHLPLSALLLLTISGLGNACRRLVGFPASAPAFVLFNILFIWGTHITVIRKGVPWVWSIPFNAECVLLVFGLYSILSSDPGLVAQEGTNLKEIIRDEVSGIKSSTEVLIFAIELTFLVLFMMYLYWVTLFFFQEEELLGPVACLEKPVVKAEERSSMTWRVRYCKYCKAYIRGFDHHCPAFGNCIGQNNHLLFIAVLVGFVMVEASYSVCSTRFIEISRTIDEDLLESKLSIYLAISTNLFCILQVIWQGVFLAWHIYCVCVNIKTDEWINWRKYPEFHCHIQCQSVHPNLEPRFRNPYDKGILRNMKEFLSPKG